MLTQKQIKFLHLLDKQITDCKKCDLFNGGRTKPYWTPNTKYVIIGEAPGSNEVKENEPFVGKAGGFLTDILFEYDFKKEEFLIINSVNCRPVTSTNSNGKPKRTEITICKEWVRKYIKVIKPEKILILGNYAKYVFTNEYGGIIKVNATSTINEEFNTNQIFSVHPSICIYQGKKGVEMLRESIEKFKEL